MKFSSTSLILVIVLALSCSGNVHQTPSNQEQALEQTRVLLKAHAQGHYDANAEAASAMYAKDSQFYGEDDAAYLSRNEIEQYYSSVYDNFDIKKATYTTSEFNVIDNTAVEIGNLSMSKNSKTGESSSTLQTNQKYMLIWENDNDKGNSWTISRAMMVNLTY